MVRRAWLAAIMGLSMPGMGQIYNGELIKGASVFVISLALYIVGFQFAVFLPDPWLMAGVLATIVTAVAIYLVAAACAFYRARRLSVGYRPTRFNHWYFYLAAWLLGAVLMSNGVYGYVRQNYIEAFRIPSGSMEPTVVKGDRVLADKMAYRRMAPKRGDVVIFIFPDDRSKRYMKRIEALPGDTVALPDGGRKAIPHGFVYVLGDNREHSVDSREFGLVPLSDVIAKVRQVYYSSGEEGIRRMRIGKVIEGGRDTAR